MLGYVAGRSAQDLIDETEPQSALVHAAILMFLDDAALDPKKKETKTNQNLADHCNEGSKTGFRSIGLTPSSATDVMQNEQLVICKTLLFHLLLVVFRIEVVGFCAGLTRPTDHLIRKAIVGYRFSF